MKCPNCKQPDFETMIGICWNCGAQLKRINGKLITVVV